MKVTVVSSWHNKLEWTVELKQGCQSFRLDISRPRDEAEWFAKMFRQALKNHDAEKVKK